MSRSAVLPSIDIEVSGMPVDPSVMQAVAEIRVQQQLSQPTQCELLLHGLSADTVVATPGDILKIQVDRQTLFSGDVTAVEYVYGSSNSRELRIRSYDRLQRLRKRQKVRSYVEVRLDELIRELIVADGVTIESTSDMPLLRYLVQWRRSDFDLLADVTERFGIYFWLDGSALRISRLASDSSPIKVELGDNLLTAHCEVNADSSCEGVRAMAWDSAFSQVVSGEAHQNLKDHSEARRDLDPDNLHADALRFVMNRTADNETQAQLIAQGELDRRASRQLVFSGVSDGDVQLRPGVSVDLQGVATLLCGSYTLTSVVHRIDSEAGYVSEISTTPPADPSRHCCGAGVSIGVVTQVQDPERLGRIRVKLAAYDDAETGWLPVVLPGIGEGKGVIAVPNVGDTVLIVEPNGDPSHGIVIGGLHGTRVSGDMGIQGDQVKRFYIRTAAPHTLSFDDVTRTIRLEDASRNSLEFSPDNVVLHATTNMRIEAPGKTIKILADKIDFERG